MQRYFLHSLRSALLLRDHCGADFADVDAAVSNAQALAADLFIESLEVGEDRSGWRLLVADEAGHEIARVTMRGKVKTARAARRSVPVQV